MPRFDADYDDDDDRGPPRRARRPEPPPRRKSNEVVIVLALVAAGVLGLGCLGAVVGGVIAFQAVREADRQDEIAAAAPAPPAVAPAPAPVWAGPLDPPQPAVNHPPAAQPPDAEVAPVPQPQPQPQVAPRAPAVQTQAPAVQPPGRPAVDRAKPLAAVTVPQPRKPTAALFGPPTTEAGATWRKVLTGEARNGPTRRDGDAFAGACWSPGGQAGFVLTRQGVLTRFRHPGLEPDLEIALDQQCDGLAVCNQGLLVTLTQLQELWVIHPDTLAVTRRAGVSMLQKALTAPGLDATYVIAGGRGGSAGVVRVGLTDGTLTEMAVSKAPNARGGGLAGGGFACAALAPDGKALYAEVSIEALGRYRIDGDRLLLEEATDRIAQGHRVGICPSPDGKYVCFPAGGGNYGANGYATFIYRTDDLQRPAFQIKNEAYPEVVGFDPVGKRIYSQNYDTPLLVFDENGTKRNEFKLGGVRGSHNVRGYAPHPDGRSLLVRSADAVVAVNLPG